jgi:hypothetical protein
VRRWLDGEPVDRLGPDELPVDLRQHDNLVLLRRDQVRLNRGAGARVTRTLSVAWATVLRDVELADREARRVAGVDQLARQVP